MKALLIIILSCALFECALFAAVCVCAHIRREARPSDALIVLGAKVRPTGAPSDTLAYRLDAAARAYASALSPLVIVCGARGSDEPATEALVMRDVLAAKGVNSKAIVMDDASVSTYTNLQNAKRIMDARGLRTAIIVTSDYHLTRALYIARKLGMIACGVPARAPRSLRVFVVNRIRETLSWQYALLRKHL